MSRLIWSPSSRDDLKGISAYLLQFDGDAAVRMLRSIRSAADRLRDYPRIGRAVNTPFRVIGVHATPYLLIYRLRGETVEIVRVRHGREDWLGEVEGAL